MLYNVFLECNAIQHGEFTLSSGKKTDLYIDARKVTLSTQGLCCIKRQFWYTVQIKQLEFDTIGGMHTGADPIVGALLTNNREPLNGFLWRKEIKEHGTKQEYEGTIPPNAKILLIDDVATTGGSLLKIINRIKQLRADVQIVAAFVIVDRQEGAFEALAAQGIPLFSCLTRSQLKKSE